MDISSNSLALFLLIIQMHRVKSQCLLGCSCMSDRHGRSIICMDSMFGAIPENLPEYITKIRIEKSHFTEIPRGAFLNTPALENLWLNFNEITVINSRSLEGLGNLTELHLQGNKLRSVSWTAFEDTPALVILDLKHNKIDVIPEHALKFLPELAYLDLSFNLLTVISKEVFLNWPLYQAMQSIGEGVGPNIVLALHDNAWLCDCRLKGFVEFIKSLRPPIILMNSYLKCSGPDFRAGKFFHEIELKECMKPVTTTSSSNISMSFGENITLHCLAKARPEPVVWWTYGLKVIRGFQGKSFSDVILLDTQTPYNFVQLVFYSESQERVDEDTISLHLQIPSIHLSDRGVYTCTANNFIGNFSVSILLDVRSSDRSSMPHLSMGLPMPVASTEENIYIEIHIAKQTVHGITIEWYAVMDRPDETWFTVHFGRTDTFKKELIHIGPRINSYSVSDLLPATKYDICVTLKNNAPRPEQCVIFVTGNDISELEQREKLIHIIVIVLAMVLAVPAGMYACTTDTKCNCCELISLSWKNCRKGEGAQVPNKHQERQGTFDSLQAGSDEGLVNRNSSEEGKVRRRSEDRSLKLKGDPGRLTAELY